MTFIAHSEARICADCDGISDCDQCPACGSKATTRVGRWLASVGASTSPARSKHVHTFDTDTFWVTHEGIGMIGCIGCAHVRFLEVAGVHSGPTTRRADVSQRMLTGQILPVLHVEAANE